MTAKSFAGIALILLTACLAGGGIYAAKVSRTNPLDPETLCPAGISRSQSIILIDLTDPLTPAEQLKVRNIVEGERDAAQPGDRIVVKLLRQEVGSSEVVLRTIINLCNPGSEANPFFQNRRRVETRYKMAFQEPIETALASVAEQTPASASPIAQSIQSTMEELTQAPGHLRFIIVSDLMEHSDAASAYNGTLKNDVLRKLIGPTAAEKLKSAAISVLLLPRPRLQSQQKTAVKIWQQTFRDLGMPQPGIMQP